MLNELVHTWVTEDVRVSPTFNLVSILGVVMLLLCCMFWFIPGLLRMSRCHLPLIFGLYSSCGNVVVEMLHELVHTYVTEDVRVSPTFNLVCILAVVMFLLLLHELVHTWVTEDVNVSPTFNLVCILAVVMLLLRCCISCFTPGLPRMSGCHLPLIWSVF